jgi:[glutamine synthetase] adenylyltransferase / [glutamine synthetase]-adenylyl-L-tyrosine phosphorylase
VARLREAGFADARAARTNIEALTPTPRDAERLAPAVPALLAALAAAPDPDMALNNLERYAANVDRGVLFATLASHPGAAMLMATIGGASQVLADTLRRYPQLFAWLLEPSVMREWPADDMNAALATTLVPFSRREARANALRRFKYRQLLRIGARDLLGDADLTATTRELANLADACLDAAWRDAEAAAREQYGVPRDADGRPTGLAIVGMGKLGAQELNYSSDIDLMFVYGADGDTAGGPAGHLPNGEYFARVARDVVAAVEGSTDEGYLFRVDLRLRPEGRMGPVALSLEGFRIYHTERAELWERQALLKARVAAGDPDVAARFMAFAQETVWRPGVDARIVRSVREMKRMIDASLRDKGVERGANVKLGRGGIREIEFLVQAMQLLYGGDDARLRVRPTLAALTQLTTRGYLSAPLGRTLASAYEYLRTVEHRLQIVHEFQTHTLPTSPEQLGALARRIGFTGGSRAAAAAFRRRHRAVTADVHRAFEAFFRERRPVPIRVRIPSLLALHATGFADPPRAAQNLRLLVEGRPLVPYAAALRRAMEQIFPVMLDALWKSPDPDEALNQFERFIAAVGPRAGYIELLASEPDVLVGLMRLCAGGDLLTQLLITEPELLTSLAEPGALVAPRGEAASRAAFAPVFAPRLSLAERLDRLRYVKQAEELTAVWRYLLRVTSIDRYSREVTALAEATLVAGWLVALAPLVERHGVPRTADGRFIPAVLVGLGKLGGRELTTGSDLDLFVVFAEDGRTDGERPVDAHTFYSGAVERLAGALADVTAAGTAFQVDLRLRPGSKGSGFASNVAALEHYYEEWGDLWERQTLTRTRLLFGDRRLGRRVRRVLRDLVYGHPLPAAALREIHAVRTRMEVELAEETPERRHVKLGRGGLVDVEFLVQALQLVHGSRHPEVRGASTLGALNGLARTGVIPGEHALALRAHYRFLRRVSAATRLLGARPPDVLEEASPMPARVATALEYPSREAFRDDYRRRTDAVRAIYDEIMT